MKQVSVFVTAIALLGSVPAAAQSAYVGASVFGEIVRLSGTSSVFGDNSAGGEAIGFTLRLGTHVADRWGVEVEFARPSEIEEDLGFRVLPAQVTLSAELDALGLLPSSLIVPPLTYRTTYRNTTISPAAFVRQDLAGRSSLVYLGGLGFYRSERQFGLSFDPRALAGATELSILPRDTETVLYGVKPFAGIEGRIGLGEHAQLVPGLRLHALEGGWHVRPAVGVHWTF